MVTPMKGKGAKGNGGRTANPIHTEAGTSPTKSPVKMRGSDPNPTDSAGACCTLM